MPAHTQLAMPIDGQRLTNWSVANGGTHLRLEIAATDGIPHKVLLPFDAVTSLLMTLPRMLRAALDARFPDGSLRVVQPLNDWRLEQGEADTGLILNLCAQGGFDVAFALNGDDASSLGAALLAAPSDLSPTPPRRTN